MDCPEAEVFAFTATLMAQDFGAGATYSWDFGDGASALTSIPTATHTYDDEGDYLLALSIETASGESGAVANCPLTVEVPPFTLACEVATTATPYPSPGPHIPDVWYGLVELTWTVAYFGGGDTVDQYTVYRQVSPTDPDELVVTVLAGVLSAEDQAVIGPGGATAPTYLLETVLRSPGFTYKVVAQSTLGATKTTNTIEAVHATSPPTAPQSVATVYHWGGLFAPSYTTITWAAPAETYGLGVYEYTVEVSGNGGPFTPLYTLGGAVLNSGQGGIIPFEQTIQYRITAINDWGQASAVSNTVIAYDHD